MATPPYSVGSALLPPVPVGRRVTFGWSVAADHASVVLVWAASLLLPIAIGRMSPILVNAAAGLLSLGLAARDLAAKDRGGLTPITMHSLLSSAAAFANVVGLRAYGGPTHERYFLYTADQHIYLASLLQLCQGALPVIGFWILTRPSASRRAMLAVPSIESRVEPCPAVVALSILSAFVIVSGVGRELFGDTFLNLLLWVPSLSAFALARLGWEKKNRLAMTAGLLIAISETFRAFFFDYLRGTIAAPLFAYTCGAILGARGLRPLRDRRFIPVLACGFLFVAHYGLLGETRERGVHGLARFADLRTYEQARTAEGADSSRQTIVARLTSFNQLSQIGALVERNGFYSGQTLEYLGYAFVPRILWPEKPKIALGAWYAMEIGQATVHGDWFNNSVNMTQAGELYLNYGWPGVFPGLLLFGAALAFFWTRARFWESDSRNIIGSGYALLMLWMVLGGHGEFTLLVSLVAIYLVLYCLALLLDGVVLLLRGWPRAPGWRPFRMAMVFAYRSHRSLPTQRSAGDGERSLLAPSKTASFERAQWNTAASRPLD